MDEGTVKVKERGRGRPSSRAAILDAAMALVYEIGAKHLTLDAVAARAGVSKGGLLYHFPSKEDLLTGMVQRHIDELMADPEILGRLRSRQPGLGLKALVECRMEADSDAAKRETASCIIAAAAERPGLLEPVRKFYRDVWAGVAKTADPDTMPGLMLGWFALEGLFMLELLEISPAGEELRQKLIAAALALLDGRAHLDDASGSLS